MPNDKLKPGDRVEMTDEAKAMWPKRAQPGVVVKTYPNGIIRIRRVDFVGTNTWATRFWKKVDDGK